MAKKAVVENNMVVNVIEVWEPPEGMALVDLAPNVGIGWSYVNGEFVAPVQPEQVEPE